ncbi:hypothetical protein AWC12_07185 [Mycolicibacterium iranicum]|uniref:Uncharacterized protein n=1 Tax=Mycolicibacterium iranicum TaxID=912594 RepID=A0A1X1WVF9_MYCIR|nr:hypothetical protein AWC12_07185 [Mycolicibacterium iranicum]
MGMFGRARLVAALLATAVTLALVEPANTGSASPTGNSDIQRGFALIWDNTYNGPQIADSLREMKAAGATWVQLGAAWGQPTKNASAISRLPTTISDEDLARAITVAHQLGLKVLLTPHLYLPAPQSRSTISPDDRPAWFAAYTQFVTHYAAMAQRLGVEQFSVGSELASISDDRPGWLGVISAVRAEYSGTLLYGAEPLEYPRIPFWDALDLIGIDAYWPLSPVPTTDAAALRQAWQPIVGEMAAFSARTGRDIVFTEAGFTSQRGTTTHPADWMISTTPDQAEQAAAYQSLLASFSDQPWWKGVYWWVWNALPDDGSDHATNYSPRGKQAEAVLRQWWL